MTTASAVAPSTSYCSSLDDDPAGHDFRHQGRLPAMKMTDRIHRQRPGKGQAKPVSRAGPMAGKMTRAKVCQRRGAEAGGGLSSTSDSMSSITRFTKYGPRRAGDEGRYDDDSQGHYTTLTPKGLRVAADPAVAGKRGRQMP